MADEPLDATLVERAAIAAVGGQKVWTCLHVVKRARARTGAYAALLSLGIPAEALNAMARGEAVVVPKKITDAMVDAFSKGSRAFLEAAFVNDDVHNPRCVAEFSYDAALAASPYARKE